MASEFRIIPDTPGIIASEADKKEYKYLTLSNGLGVMLACDKELTAPTCMDQVSDPVEEECDDASDTSDDDTVRLSAVAMCINVGSLYEPVEFQGLMHYLEHMIFMGSEKYPAENDFDAFVSERGGYSNAYTDNTCTLFYFTVLPQYLLEALDRFSHFFISPLLSKDCMDRELQAVHSEYEMSILSDDWRIHRLICITAVEGHPVGQFGMGNVKSLKDDPESKGYDRYSYLQNLRRRMYSSHYMKLSIQSMLNLCDLEAPVAKMFEQIPNNGLEAPSIAHLQEPFNTEEFTSFYKVVPMKEHKALYITWCLPPVINYRRSKPLSVISHLVGHETRGSIISYMRKENLALELTCGDDQFDNECMSVLQIVVVLTPKGLENIETVLRIIFEFLLLIRRSGVSRELFDQYQLLKRNKFRFKEEQSSSENVQDLARDLNVLPIELSLCGRDLIFDYDPVCIDTFVANLTPDKANFVLVSSALKDECDHNEEWYNVPYGKGLPHSESRSLGTLVGGLRALDSARSELHLPFTNEYIPTSFSIHPQDTNVTDKPEVLLNSLGNRLFYSRDSTFLLPRTYVNVNLVLPYMDSSTHFALLEVLVRVLKLQLAEDLYDAELAGLSCDIYANIECITFSMNGFSHTLCQLLRTLCEALGNFRGDAELLESVRQRFREKLHALVSKPGKISREYRLKLLHKRAFLPTEVLAGLKDSEQRTLSGFIEKFLIDTHFDVYVHGNETAESAAQYFQCVKDVLFAGRLPTSDRELKCRNQTAELLLGEYRIGIARNVLSETDTNLSTTFYYQAGVGTVRKSVLNRLLIQLLEEPAFNFLRTEHQLGYDVGIYETESNGVIGFVLHVESHKGKFSLSDVEKKMNEFVLQKAPRLIGEMTSEQFDRHVNSLMESLMKQDDGMSQPFHRNCGEIDRGAFLFDRRKRSAEFLKSINKTEVIAMYNGYMSEESMRKLVARIDIADSSDREMTTDDNLRFYIPQATHGDHGSEITDMSAFKSALTFHPYCSINS